MHIAHKCCIRNIYLHHEMVTGNHSKFDISKNQKQDFMRTLFAIRIQLKVKTKLTIFFSLISTL